MIEVHHLYKSFDDKDVLKDINAEFMSGKCNMIIGKSGSGKTVLLKNLIGLIHPDQGDIIYDGNSLINMTAKEKKILHQNIGILFQGSALYDFATVLENVMFPLNFFSDMPYEDRLKRAHFCLERVNIKGSDDKFPAELSGGMQKRVGIARAIALSPKYLFCDEPNSGLDPYTSILIDKLIKEITEEFNMTTVINTHDMNSMLEHGDNIYFINEGRAAWHGDKHTILNTDDENLREFICANTLARNIMEGGNV